jgi:hypothetical protein
MSPAALDKARGEAIALIARHQGGTNVPDVILEKARLLLTKHWIRATWGERQHILKSADWLMRTALPDQRDAV